MRDYVQASATANFGTAPAKSIKLAAPQGIDACKSLCFRRATRPLTAPAGCHAFSVSVVPHRSGDPAKAARYCNVYDEVPYKLCGAGDKEGLCAYGSEGSWRVKYV